MWYLSFRDKGGLENDCYKRKERREGRKEGMVN